MKNYILLYKIVLISLIAILSSRLNAQEKIKSIITCNYKGETNGIAILATYDNYISYRNNLDADEDTTTINDSKFRFEITNKKQPIYFSLSVPKANKKGQILYLYALAPNSNIYIDASADTIIFSGQGSEVLTSQYLISKVNKVNGIYKPLFKSPIEQDNLLKKWGDYDYKVYTQKGYDSVYHMQFQILLDYKPKLSKLMFQRLWRDLEDEKLYPIYSNFFSYSFYKYPEETKQALLKFYKDKLFDFKLDTSDVTNKVNAKLYATTIIAKLQANIIYNTIPRMYQSDKVDSILYHELNSQFKGILHERLLTEFMIKMFRKGSLFQNDYYAKVLPQIKEPYLRRILKTYESNIQGRPAYDFSLPDKNGKLISLKQFEGKVLVIDFWFKGCSQCISLEEQMRVVRQHFKDNTNIVFLSLNVDYKKATWLEGIASGKYTDAENINISLYGLGFKHPFLRYYSYTGFPQLLIIDRNQKVVTAKPDKPFYSSDRPKFTNYLESLL